MNMHSAVGKPGILAASLFLALSTVSFAAPPDAQGGGRCGPADEHGMRGPLPPPPGFAGPGGFGFGAPGGLGGPGPGHEMLWGAPPPFLHDLKLTEEQQDKVFSILYAAAPHVHEQEKALHKAHEALRELNTSGQYDESRAKSLVETVTQAEGQLMLLRLRSEHDIFALLTPEQRKTLEERRNEHGPKDHADKPSGSSG